MPAMLADPEVGAGITQALDMMMRDLHLAAFRSDWDEHGLDEVADDVAFPMDDTLTCFGLRRSSLAPVLVPGDHLLGATQQVVDLRDVATLQRGSMVRAGSEASAVIELHGGGEPLFDLEHALQLLLLQEGVLEDRELAVPSPTAPAVHSGVATPPTGSPGHQHHHAPTLRELRRTGVLADLTETAQTALLGGTLFAYEEAAHGADSEEEHDQDVHCLAHTGAYCEASPDRSRRAVPALQGLLRLHLDRALDHAGLHAPGAVPAGGAATLAPRRHRAGSEGGLAPATQEGALEHSARSFSSASSSARSLRRSTIQPPAQRRPDSAGLSSANSGLRGAGAAARAAAHAHEEWLGPRAGHPHPHRHADVGADADAEDDEEEEGVMSIVAFETPQTTPRSAPEAHSSPPAVAIRGRDSWGAVHAAGTGSPTRAVASPHRLDNRHMADTGAWTLEDTLHSVASTARSEQTLQQSARTVFGEAMGVEGSDDDEDAGLLGVLGQLGLESLALDESLARSVRRVLQLGTVLAGQRLTDEEIRDLPTVRFEAADHQSCAICLEPYHKGELLTALRCSHFFHVDCLGQWFRQSTQCPLCRSQCGE